MNYPNGSESVISLDSWGQLIGVKHCPCEDGIARRVKEIGVPDTAFSAPGRIQVKGKTISGFVTCDDQGYRFISNKHSKNAHLLFFRSLN